MLHDREAALARVEAAFAATARNPRVLLLAGPLGCGRTALLRHLPAVAPAGSRVLRLNASRVEREFPFGVARQFVDQFLTAPGGGQAAVAARRLDDLLDAEERPAPGAAGRVSTEILRATHALLAAAGGSPLLLLVDDLHWVDDLSLRWLGHLTRRMSGLPVLVVCTLADGDDRARRPLVREVVSAADEVVRLGPLTPDTVRLLLTGDAGEGPHPTLVRAVHEATGGNALLATTVSEALRHEPFPEEPDGDVADRAARAVREVCPPAARDRVAVHLQAQPGAVRDVAAAVAALGDGSDPELLARLAGVDEVGFAAARRSLVQSGILTAGREVRLVHGVVRHAIDSYLSRDEREASHDAAADLLYRCGRPAEEVAAHLLAVVHPGRPWSVAVLRAAADQALRERRFADAARYLRRALLHSRSQDERRAQVLLDLAAAERGTDRDACERHLAQAVALLRSPRDRAAAALRVPPRLLGAASPSGVELVERAATDLAATGHRDAVTAELTLRLEARRRHSAHEHPDELAASVARLRSLGDVPAVDSAAQRELVAVLLSAAALSGAVPAAQIAATGNRILEREPATAAHSRTTLPLVMTALFAAESVGGAESWLAGEQRGPRLPGTEADEVELSGERAFVMMATCRPAQAREHVERALAGDARTWSDAAVMHLGWVAMELRDRALARRLLAQTAERRDAGLVFGVTTRILRAAADAESGARRKGLETLLTCGRQLENAGWRNSSMLPWRLHAIGLHQRLGEYDAARTLVDDELRWARSWGAPAHLGRVLRMKGWMLRGEGVEVLREAVEVLRSSPYRVELARTLVVLGRRLRNGAEAEAALREAAAVARDCGVPWLAQSAGRSLDSVTVPITTTLTPSERRVVSLVGRGLTNRDIATELGVSSRAVEKHLTSVYRKLGVAGRQELVDALPG